MNNSFQINDGLHLQALAPLPLVRYKELFCNHQHEIILNYDKRWIVIFMLFQGIKCVDQQVLEFCMEKKLG